MGCVICVYDEELYGIIAACIVGLPIITLSVWRVVVLYCNYIVLFEFKKMRLLDNKRRRKKQFYHTFSE